MIFKTTTLSLHHSNNEDVLLSLLSIHSSCFVSLMLIVLSTFHVIYPFLSKIFIYIPVYMYCPVVLWCFVIMCDLWPFKGQTIEFVTNYPVLLILHVGIMNNYNKTTVHNIILFYPFNYGRILIEVLLFTTFVYTCYDVLDSVKNECLNKMTSRVPAFYSRWM